MDRRIYLWFAVLKLFMYETLYDKLEPYSGEKNYKHTIWIPIASY